MFKILSIVMLASSLYPSIKTLNANDFYGEAAPLTIGSSDLPLTDEDLLNAISWSVAGVNEKIISNAYLGTSKLGTYYYVVEGECNGKRKTITNIINVIDNTPPVASIKYIQIGNNSYLTKEQMLQACVAQDNSGDILTYSIVNDNYNQTKTPGTYTYEVEVEDPSGNKTLVQGIVEVLDCVAPSIIGPSKIVSTYDLMDEEILSQYQIKDDYSHDVTVEIIHGDSTNIIKATDEAGNTTEKEISVEIKKEEYKVIYVANKCLVDSSNNLKLNDLKSVAAYLLNINASDVTSVSSDYFENPSKLGTYKVSVAVENKTYSFELEVFKHIEKEEHSNWFINVFKWIYKYILTPIGHFFIMIWNWIKKAWKWIFG